MEMLENRMIIDSEWDEIDYGSPNRRRLRRFMEECEAEEREDLEDEFI